MSDGSTLTHAAMLSMTVVASSVMLTKNARMFNSMSLMRSPAAFRTTATRSATVS